MSRKSIAVTLLILLSLTMVYHLLIVTSVIPYSAVWGGRLDNYQQMLRFEAFSILVNAVIILVVSIKAGWIYKSQRWVDFILWLVFILYLLNTIGNLFSLNNLEAYIFTPLTLVLSILIFKLIRSKEPE